MKTKVGLWLGCGLLIILGISCKSIGTNAAISTVTPEIPPNWWTSWLTHPVCRPPCWQNITPGKTTRDEAVAILEHTPGIIITYNNKDGLSWNFGTKTEEGNIILSEDGIVSSIWMDSVSDRKLFLKTIVASFGYPKYVKSYDCREGICSTALVYPDMGMFLVVFTENKSVSNDAPQVEILSDSVVNRVYFIEPGEKSFLDSLGFQESDLVKWKGYGGYP